MLSATDAGSVYLLSLELPNRSRLLVRAVRRVGSTTLLTASRTLHQIET